MNSIAPEMFGILLVVPPRVRAWIDELIATGLYGQTSSEVVVRLVCDGVRRELEPGGLLRDPPPEPRKRTRR